MSTSSPKLNLPAADRQESRAQIGANMKWSNSVGGVSPFYGSPLIRRYVKVSRQCNNPQQLLAFIENDEWESGLPSDSISLNAKLGYLSSLIDRYCSPQSITTFATLAAAIVPLAFSAAMPNSVSLSATLSAMYLILMAYILYLAARNTSIQRLRDCIDYLIRIQPDSTDA